MAQDLTTEQRALLRKPNLKARLLTTWYMDSGIVRFCDDVEDIVYGGYTWIGASALASVSEIKASNGGTAAEPVKIIVDGTRMYQAGFDDPAGFFRLILEEQLHNRKVDLDLAIAEHDSNTWGLVLPLYAGKINHAKIVDPDVRINSGENPQPNLEIVVDSLFVKLTWITQRVRSHQDQLEIDPTDMFFSFVHNNVRNEQLLYWGKKPPAGTTTSRQAAILTLARFVTGGRVNLNNVTPR